MRKNTFNSDRANILLLLFVVIQFVTRLGIHMIMQYYADNWFLEPIIFYIYGLLALLQGFSFILPALAIKNKIYKIIGIVMSSIIVLHLTYTLIYAMVLFASNQ